MGPIYDARFARFYLGIIFVVVMIVFAIIGGAAYATLGLLGV